MSYMSIRKGSSDLMHVLLLAIDTLTVSVLRVALAISVPSVTG